ncbi:MAG: 4Fe-4S binding protein, partial [Anaerolineaceae bacterium]|nr:4Fe-4S binding protein [Anaerolineaceae bacterium]
SGKGRFISLDEAFTILDKSQKAGLVLQPANSQNPIFLCACCGCCCGVLRHIKADPNPASLVANPYHAQHDPELCTACGLCLEVCPMDALTLANDGSIAFDQMRCIGCGLCVGVCPTGAVRLERKPAELQPVPPKNIVGTYLKMALKRKSWTVFDMAALVIKSFIDRLIAPHK